MNENGKLDEEDDHLMAQATIGVYSNLPSGYANRDRRWVRAYIRIIGNMPPGDLVVDNIDQYRIVRYLNRIDVRTETFYKYQITVENNEPNRLEKILMEFSY